MSLSFIALQCAQLLAKAQTKQTLGPVQRAIEDTLVRFKIWAGNVGIFAPANASVEYRLRQDEEILAVLSSILASLKDHLEKAVSATILEEPEDAAADAAAETSQPSSTSSESSCSISLDSDASESALLAQTTGTGPSSPADAMAKANDEIDRLYRLASVLRKPVSSTENVRVRDFIAKKLAAGDTEDMDDAEDHARSHLQARFPNAAPFLVDRLVEAVVLRRMQLRYRERHQGKLRQGVEQSFVTEAPRAIQVADPAVVRPVPQVQRSVASSMYSKSLGAENPGHSVVWSATTASSVDRARYARYAESATLSGITHSAVPRRLYLDVPAPPQKFDERLRKVTCSFCMKLISKEETQEPRWTRHILKDIKPYVCLFPGCSYGDALFSSTEEWLGHLQWQHTIMWACQAAGHEDYVFGSEQELEQHIRDSHPGSFAEAQLPDLVSQGARPAADTFAMLAMLVDNKEADESLSNPCPICRKFQPSTEARPDEVEASVTGDIQAHIMEHLETIALLSLPGKDDEDAAESNVKQSSQNSAENKLATLELSSNDSNHELNTDSASDHDTAHQQDQQSYVPLDDDQHWREVCQLVKMDFPKPEDDPVLLLWHQRTAHTSSSRRFWSPDNEQVRRWLFPSPVTVDEEPIIDRIEGGADWFLAREDVQIWCSGTGTGTPETRTLWLRGDSGCGKTVCSASVLEHLLTKRDRFALYFSFSGLPPEKQTLDTLVRTLILQLCKLNDKAVEHLATLFGHHPDSEAQPTTEDLSHLLQTMLQTEGPIHIILDALDTSTPDCDALYRWLRIWLLTLSQVRFLLVSDLEPVWYKALYNLVHYSIGFEKQVVETAMYRIIEAQFRDDSAFSSLQLPRELREQMSTTIIDTASMNFRTAKRTLHFLLSLTTQSEIEEALGHMAHVDFDGHGWYSAYLNAIPQAVKSDSMRLLQFIAHGRRPLTDAEVGEVLATREGSTYPNGEAATFAMSDFFPHPVTTIISASQGSVYLSDPAVRAFLLDMPAFGPKQANKAILRTCLTYLANLDRMLDNNIGMIEFTTRFPLTLYIGPHLMKHARASGHDVDAVQALVEFFEDRTTFSIWKCLQTNTWPPLLHSTEFSSPLFQACSAGLVTVTQRLIERGANVNPEPFEKLGTPLMVSALLGYERIARILLQKGAAANTRGGIYDTALQAACRHGQMKIVQLLLDHGADVNLQGGEFGSALQASTLRMREDMISLLLSKGANPNAMGGTSGTALQIALRVTRTDIAHLLLDHGADPNLTTGAFEPPLMISICLGDEYSVRLLISNGARVRDEGDIRRFRCTDAKRAPYKAWPSILTVMLEAGADVNEQDSDGNTILHLAAKYNAEEGVEFLLQQGADISIKNKDLDTPLMVASLYGYPGPEKMLKDAEALV